MTKIAIVRGLNDNVGEPIPERMPFINFALLTDGEMSLYNAKTRLWNLHYMKPQNRKIYAKGAALIDNILSKGVHGIGNPYFGTGGGELSFVFKAIREARKKVTPAGGTLFRQNQDIRKGLDLDNVNGVEINVEDFLRKNYSFCFNNGYNPSTNTYGDYSMKQTAECSALYGKVVEMVKQLNTYLPRTSHHSIYQFMTPQEANDTPIVAAKYVNHTLFVGGIQKASEISPENIKTWMRNCIEWKNGQNGMLNVSPEDVIKIIKANPNYSTSDNWNNPDVDKINDLFTLALVVMIIIASCKGIAGIIQVVQGKEPTAFAGLEQIATMAGWAASGTDFLKNAGTGGNNGGTGNNGNNGGTGNSGNNGGTGNNGNNNGGNGGDDEGGGGSGLMDWIKENPIPSALIGIGLGVGISKL